MSSRLGAKTYGRKQECKSNLQFDHLIAEKGAPKPSSAKMSVAAVHRWGMTSFTSLRKNAVNGQQQATEDSKFNETNDAYSSDPFAIENSVNNVPPSHSLKSIPSYKTRDSSSLPKPKKFFKSHSSKNSVDAASPVKLEVKLLPTVNIFNHVATVPDYPIPPPYYMDQKEDLTTPSYNHSVEENRNNGQTSCEDAFDLLMGNVPPPPVATASEERTSQGRSSPAYVPDFDDEDDEVVPTRVVSPPPSRVAPLLPPPPSELLFPTQQPLSSTKEEEEEIPKSALQQDSTEHRNSSSQPRLKNSFFRSKIFNSPKKKRALYKHRPWSTNEDEMESQESTEGGGGVEGEPPRQQEEEVAAKVPKLVLRREVQPPIRPGLEPQVSFKCSKEEKQLFTVVKNVKQAHQCHESGETQEFNDDIEYLLESIQPANPTGARALGVLSFASKCMGPAFRIHLRAHGIIPKIFSALQDAPINAVLGMCTAGLMFVLSQDRLTMDLEASTLNLMLKLLESGSAPRDKYTERVFQLCEQLQAKGLAKHINLDDLSTASLAMETLLGMASKRAGDWFKEELRNLGGLDHIVETVGTCVRDVMPQCLPVLTPAPTEKLLKLDRCLRILESVSYKCPENQTYLTSYKQSMLIFSCVRLLKLCLQNLSSIPPLEAQLQTKDSPAWVQLTCLLSLLKLFVILTHENGVASTLLGEQPGLLEHMLGCVLTLPRHTPPERRFDILVLSLGLLINLMENCEANRERLVMAKVGDLSAMQCLVELCLVRLQSAQKSEEHTDAILDGQDQQPSSTAASSLAATTQTSDLEELLTKALQKAGKNMEHSIIGAYIALLLGCVIQNNEDFASLLRDHMPDGNFKPMTEILKKFLEFVSFTGVVENSGVTSMQRIVAILEKN